MQTETTKILNLLERGQNLGPTNMIKCQKHVTCHVIKELCTKLVIISNELLSHKNRLA